MRTGEKPRASGYLLRHQRLRRYSGRMTSARFQLPPQGCILLVDKLEGWTSHDVVAKARRALSTRKVGHAGTLDPLATGLLVLGAGPSTRLLTYLVGLSKEYRATIRLGATTVTDDSEGEITGRAPAEDVDALLHDLDRIRAAAAELVGDILQAPSAVSAIKVDGRRAYDRVRSGEAVTLKERPVTVDRFDLGSPKRVALENGVAIDIEANVHCSTGTYVRALARDLGEKLGIGGHLTALRRTRVGPFDVEDAISMESLIDGEILLGVKEPAAVAATLFPQLALSESQALDLGHGKRVVLGEDQLAAEQRESTDHAAAIAPDGRLIGIVSVTDGRVKPISNFPTADTSQNPGGRAK